jgi:hypothetical protein
MLRCKLDHRLDIAGTRGESCPHGTENHSQGGTGLRDVRRLLQTSNPRLAPGKDLVSSMGYYSYCGVVMRRPGGEPAGTGDLGAGCSSVITEIH